MEDFMGRPPPKSENEKYDPTTSKMAGGQHRPFDK